jgi:hypothetical protein
VLLRFSLKEALYKALPPPWQTRFRMQACWIAVPGPPFEDGPVALHLEGLSADIPGSVWWLTDAVISAVWIPVAALPPKPPAP